MSGLFGNLYDKFFTAEGLQQTMADPRFQVGIGLLGRTDMPFGQALGRTMNDMAAQQMLQQRFKAQQQEQEKQRLQQAAQQQLMQQNPKLAPYLQAYPSAAPAILGSVFKNPTDAPSNVREWEYFTRLAPEEKKQYLTMKRANQVLDRGSEYYIPNPANPGVPSATVPKDLAPEQRPEVKGEQAAATAAGSATGKAQADAVIGLDKAVAEAQNAVSVIDKMMSHPGLDYAVGASSVLPIIPGTPAADFDALAKQLEGKTFLQAYEALKGGGVITEIEGQKATEAMARLGRAQTEQEYRASLREFKNIIQRGISRAQSKARRAPQQGGEFSGFRIVE